MLIEQITFEEYCYAGSFTLKDLDDAFYERAVAAYYYRSGVMGGPGGVRIITEDNEQYEIGMDMMRDDEFGGDEPDYELSRVCKSIRLFEINRDKNGWRFHAEDQGWTCLENAWAGDVLLVRNDYLEIIRRKRGMMADPKGETQRIVLHPFDRISLYLRAQGKEPVSYIYEGTKQYRLNLQQEWEMYKAGRERVCTRPEGVEPEPHIDNRDIWWF